VHLRTVIISVLLHAALAAGLLRASEKKRARRATVVAVTEKKKAEKPKEEKPKPPPPKAPPKVANNTPKAAAPSEAPKPAAAPVHVAQTFSNDDVHAAATGSDGPGLAVLPARPAAAKPAAASTTKVASAMKHRQEGDSAVGGQGEVVCEEEPTKPVPIFKPDIEYTNEARAAGVEGRLVLHLEIGADGSVTNVVVVATVDAALDAAAIATVQKWRFKPAMRCGKPVAGGEYTLARRFELGD
jgi:protein TonB